MVPPYIPPRCSDAPKVKISKRTWVLLIAPLVPKGVKASIDIFLILWKLSFVDHDTKKQKYLDRVNYRMTVQDTLDALK